MVTFLVCVLGIVFVVLTLVASIHPDSSQLSLFELKRRTEAADGSAASLLRREVLLPDILSLQRVVVSVLLVIFVALGVHTLGWLIGIIVSVVIALEYGAIARIPFVKSWAQKIYGRYEQPLLRFVEKFAGVLRLVRSATFSQSSVILGSKQELERLVATSGSLLSVDEKRLIVNGIGFESRQVVEIMTPRSVIDSVSKKELLGPLVLDDLHKTGHSRIPVVDGNIDHIVGMLHLQDLLTLDGGRRSTTVEKAMESRVFYIHEHQSLQHALAAFLRTRHHLFIVVNEFRETVGLLSLEDVIEALLGRKIIDEFDTHEDLRVVAMRNPRGNNHTPNSTNV